MTFNSLRFLAGGRFFHYFKGSLAAQLYGLVSALTLVAWATFYWGHLHSEASGMVQVRLRSSAFSLAYAENLARTLERTDAALLALRARWLETPTEVPAIDNLLGELLANSRFHLSFVASSAADRQGMPPDSSVDALRVQLQEVPAGSPPQEALHFIRAVFKEKQFSGNIVLSVEPEFLTQFSRKMDSDSGTVIGVMRGDGTLLAHSADTSGYMRSAFVASAAKPGTLNQSSPEQATFTDDDAERTVSVYRLPKYDLTVLVSTDVARQMAPDRTRKHIVLLFAVLFPLLLGGATWAILQSLARRQSVEKSLRDSERLAASVFTHAREGIAITDIRGHILDVNSTFTAITGFAREAVIGAMPDMLRSDRQSPEFYAAMGKDLVSKGHWSGDIWSCRNDGSLFAALLTISVVRDASDMPQHYVALFTDITEIKDHERQLAHMAHYDSLSSLPNRVLLADRLRQAMLQCQRRDKSLVVAFLDLDGFKEVNDTYGHDAGDEMLIALAQSMRGALRDGDTLARLGGDEFVAVLVDLDNADECYPVLDRLLEAAHQQIVVRHKQGGGNQEVSLQVSASIGFTCYPQENVDADLLLRQADQAMYQAKQAGKNRYHLFDVAFDAELKTRTESIERIRQALANEEFVLYFQPKVNMKAGQVIGAEALIRWQHPERGLLAPQHFLPVIENHALSIALGEWVVSTALRQMEQWRSQELSLCVSVNISARHLQQENFSFRLADMLAHCPAVAAHTLELEILETSAMEDMAKVTENIHRCRALGVRFALDDFGTGYSSLTYLKRLPAEILKIDQSFVRDMLEDADDRAIVESIIGLAQSFQRTVIAEGVETAAHGALLMQMGCDLAQGYGIARPMPAIALPSWVARWRGM